MYVFLAEGTVISVLTAAIALNVLWITLILRGNVFLALNFVSIVRRIIPLLFAPNAKQDISCSRTTAAQPVQKDAQLANQTPHARPASFPTCTST